MIETFILQPGQLDYALLDSGRMRRLERWGKEILIRPDPQAIWQPHLDAGMWDTATAQFITTWKHRTNFPAAWPISWQNEKNTARITLEARLTPFKHTGVFPEQAANWDWLCRVCPPVQPALKILNLFAYTGGASMVIAKLGHHVTHVDASKPAIAWAKRNQELNHIQATQTRWILDDAIKFSSREVKRGARYDGIIMDPPSFGHGPSGHTWKLTEGLPKLLAICQKLLSSQAKFVLINSYAGNISALALANLTQDIFGKQITTLNCGELCLQDKAGRLLSTGVVARCKL